MNKLNLNKSFIAGPGPGSYNLSEDPNSEGKYACSSYKNLTDIKFYKSKRFNYIKQSAIPGPGEYKHISTFNGSGINFLSTIKSSNARSILNKTKSKLRSIVSNQLHYF